MVGEAPEEGTDVHALTGLLGTVVAHDDTVTVDYEPERTGQSPTFEVEVLKIE
ncbi:MAG: hypothetical protein V5A43_08755 [Haloarculaceae archaeon]